jgi:hypothetical protein
MNLRAIYNRLLAIENICVEIRTLSNQTNIDLANFRNAALPLVQNIDQRLLTFVETYYFQFHLEYLAFFQGLEVQ